MSYTEGVDLKHVEYKILYLYHDTQIGMFKIKS